MKNYNIINLERQHFKKEFMPGVNQFCQQTQRLITGKIVKITKTNIYFDVKAKNLVKAKKKIFIRNFFKLFGELNSTQEKKLSLSKFLEEIKINRSFKFILYKINSAQENLYIDYDKTNEYSSYQRSFYELDFLRRSGQAVHGYILNSVNGGFSVGLNGLVAFAPNNELAIAAKGKTQAKQNYLFLGSRMNFRVAKINFERRNVILTRDK